MIPHHCFLRHRQRYLAMEAGYFSTANSIGSKDYDPNEACCAMDQHRGIATHRLLDQTTVEWCCMDPGLRYDATPKSQDNGMNWD